MAFSSPTGVVTAQWTRAARGFSCIFWGLALCVLLTTRFVRIFLFEHSRLPSHLPGLALVLLGAIMLHRAGPLTVQWKRHATSIMLAALFQVYLIPFVVWWKALPHFWLFAGNMLVLALATVWLLVAVAGGVANLARATQDQVLYYEAQMVKWIATLALTLTAGMLAFRLGIIMLRDGELGMASLHGAIYALPGWLQIFILAPFLLVLAVTWEGKEHCISRMNGFAVRKTGLGDLP